MKIDVRGPRVLIRPDALATISTGGIHMVHDRSSSTMRGTVVAIGSGPEFARRNVGAALDELADRIENKYVRAAIEEIRASFVPEHIVALGDRVLFSPDAGEQLIFEKETIIVMQEDDVLAVIEE